MKKRDIIEEIKSIKSRSEYNSRHDYSSRLSDIEYALKEFTDYNGNFNHELLKYIPISTVACFEAFFSSAIAEVIDFGKPYSDNIATFNQSKNIRLDFEVVAAIQKKTLTVGEFVAHILPFNNLDDINSNLSILIGEDFLKQLKSFRKKSIFDDANIINETFHTKTAEIIESVKQTYELRHIFCHEFATNLRVDQGLIMMNFENCKIFLEHSNAYIWELLYPNSPETQTEMNIKAHEEFENWDIKLSEVIKQIKKGSSEKYDEELFDQSMIQWKEYRHLYAAYKASCVTGGSLYPSFYSSSMTYITREKIKRLETEFHRLLRTMLKSE